MYKKIFGIVLCLTIITGSMFSSNFYNSKEAALGNIIFSNHDFSFFSFDYSLNVNEDMEFLFVNKGSNMSFGDENGFNFGFISRKDLETDEKLNIQYLNFRNNDFILGHLKLGVLFESFKNLYAIGLGFGTNNRYNANIDLYSQINLDGNKLDSLNLGAKASFNGFYISAGIPEIAFSSLDIKSKFIENFNFGAGFDFGKLEITASASYSIENNKFDNLNASLMIKPFAKKINTLSTQSYSQLRQQEIELQKQREKTKVAIAGIVAGTIISIVAITAIFLD
jgi:hypothetical protein